MRSMIVLSLLFVSSPLLRSQLTVSRPEVGPDGRTKLSLENDSTQPLTAYVLTWNVPRPTGSGHASLISYRDSLIEDNVQPLLPSTTGTVKLGSAQTDQPQIAAAVYEDGSIYGDSDWTKMIVNRRRLYAVELGGVIKILNSLPSQTASQGNLIVTTLKESMNSELSSIPGETSGVEQLFSEPTQAVKARNLEIISLSDRREAVRIAFLAPIKHFTKSASNPDTSTASLANSIQFFIDRYTKKESLLLSSKPALNP